MRRKIFKSNDVDIVPGEMSNIDVNLISLVRKGANKQKIQIYKADEEPSDGDEPTSEGFFSMLKDYFGGKRIEKGDAEAVSTVADQKVVLPSVKNFKAMMAVKDITENMWRVNDTLSTVLRDILNNPAATDKKTLMEQAIDQYADYMKSKINSVKIEKADPFFAVDVEKAGKAISSGNLEKIKAAQGVLTELIEASATPPKDDPEDGKKKESQNGPTAGSEVEPDDDPDKKKKEEDEEVKKSEIADIVKAAVAEAVKPYEEKIAKMEKEDGGTQVDETDIEKEDLAGLVAQAVASAMAPVSQRMAVIEKSRGIGNSQLGQEAGGRKVEKADGTFQNFFVGEEA